MHAPRMIQPPPRRARRSLAAALATLAERALRVGLRRDERRGEMRLRG